MTEAERKLWTYLRARQLAGVKFRRQHQIGPYIVDFVSFEPKLVIEIDGGHHALKTEEDGRRRDWLVSNGYQVIRFWNDEVLQRTHEVLETIKYSLCPFEKRMSRK